MALEMQHQQQPVFLKKQLDVKELEKGTEFEIDPDDPCYSSDEDFEDELSNSFKAEFNKLKIDDSEEINLSSLNVTELKQYMQPITDDGLVLKVTTYGGTGIVIPPKSIVLLHYNAYVEEDLTLFDSTYRRGQPFKFLLGGRKVVLGLDLGVATMRKGEHAKFWVDCSYAYGPIGCPPRIPTNANILYDVEVVKFFDCKDAIEFEEMLPDDQRTAPFSKVYKACKVEHELGNDLFLSKKYSAAASRYAKSVRLLEQVNAANEEEDLKREKLLVKLYLNLSLTNFRMKKASRAIYNASKAHNIDSNNPRVFFRLGQAYGLNSEFGKAKDFLLKAKKIKPYDSDINKALLDLDNKAKTYVAWQKSFCQNIFRTDDDDKNEILSQESEEFRKVIEDTIEKFETSGDEEYSFPSTFTASQIEVIKVIAQSHKLHLVEKIYNGQKIIKVKKLLTDLPNV